MGSTPVFKKNIAANEQGIAIFLVLSCIAILGLLINEFVYVAQVNKRMAWTALDQIQAHYTAKSALKLSLLRLKAYQNVKSLLSSNNATVQAMSSAVPKQLIELIWSFPLVFPFPDNIPGLSIADRDQINKFQKNTRLNGNFTALIESESSKFQINSILKPFGIASNLVVTTTSVTSTTGAPRSTTTTTGFNVEDSRKAMNSLLENLFDSQSKSDEDFASRYRDIRIEDISDALIAWGDWSYQRKNRSGDHPIKDKGAPYYSIQELHMIDGMDDDLVEVITPYFTTQWTPGVNVNTLQASSLKALFPNITEEEVKKFFEYRDSKTEDHLFKSADDFFKYLQENLALFRGDAKEVERVRKELLQRGIDFIADESSFKITATATVNQSTRIIEAWVVLYQSKTTPPPTTVAPNTTQITEPERPDPGLRITFMRFL